MGVVMYKDFVALKSSYTTATFGSTTTSNILKTVESFSDDVSFESSIANSSDLPESSEGLVHNILFLCPLSLSESMLFDGPIYGNIRVNAWSSDGYSFYCRVTKIYVDIVSVDSSGNETSLIGGETQILSSEILNSSTTNYYRSVPFWLDISKKQNYHEERIGLRVKVYGYALSGYGDTSHTRIYLLLGSDGPDTFFALPVAVAGE